MSEELQQPRTLQELRAFINESLEVQDEIANAIPPVYTEWIGRQLLQALGQRRQAVRIQMCECGCGQIARTPAQAGRPGRFYSATCRKRVHRASQAPKGDVTKFVERALGE